MCKSTRFLSALFFLCMTTCLSAVFAHADILDNLTIRNPLPQGSQLNAVTYAGGKFVAAGYNAAILTSSDGLSWMQRLSDRSYNLENDWFAGVAYGNGAFVAVGHWGQIYTSTDAISWSKRDSGTTYELNAVAYGTSGGASLFVAVGNSGLLLTSPDGVTWTPRDSKTTSYLRGVTYGNSKFVAVGDTVAGSGTIITSPDGINWTPQVSNTTSNLNGVVYGGAGFTAVGGGGTTCTSSDGSTWTAKSGSSNLYAVSFGNSRYVAVGASGTIVTSTDNSTWNPATSGTTSYLYGITFGNGTFVAVGDKGVILTSPDGITWTSRTTGTVATFNAFASGNGVFVGVGAGGTIMTSPDGISWTERYSGTTNPLNAVAYGQNKFVAVGGAGTILVSTDGATWAAATSGTSDILNGITWGNGTFVAVGGGTTVINGTNGGQILTSSNGTTWVPRASGSSTPLILYGITYGNGTFVTVGATPYGASPANAFVFSSPDGQTWAEHSAGTTTALYGVAYGNGMFVAVGYNGIIRTTTDLINLTNWTPRTSGTTYLKSIIFANGVFTAVGAPVLTSTDGIAWPPVPSGTSVYLYGAATDGRTYVIGGQNGTILSTKVWTTSKTTVAPAAYFKGVAYGNGAFVAVGGHGTIYSSQDGNVWTPRDSGLTPNSLYYDAISYLYGVTYGNSKFVAVGSNDGRDPGSAILTSTNGTSWLRVTSGITDQINGIAYGNGTYVAIRENGRFLTSSNGSVWYELDTGNTTTLNNIIFANNLFVAVGAQGTILTSANGGTWFKRETGTTYNLSGVAYGNGVFVAVGTISGSEGVVLTSPDGSVWTERPADATYWNVGFNAVTFGDGMFTAAGYSGRIMASADGIQWTGRTTGSTDRLTGITYGNGRFVAVGRDNCDILTSVTGSTRILTIFKAGNGGGTITANIGTIAWNGNTGTSLPYAANAQVILTAVPAGDGSTFIGWNGCASSTGTQCTVSMDASRTATATFLQNGGKFTLNVTKDGSGSGNVSANPGTIIWNGNQGAAAFDGGTPVVLTAAAATGSTFTGWSGEGCSGTGTCTVTMGVSRYVTATFTLNDYRLTVAPAGNGGGTVISTSPDSPVITCPGSCSADFPYGTTVGLAAYPSWHSYVSWANCTQTGNNCSALINGDKTVTATFNYNQNVRYAGTTYGTIMSAYGIAASGGTIQAKDSSIVVFMENLSLDRPCSVTLEGGKDNSWNTIGYSAVKGTLEIGGGSVTINRIMIVP